VISDLAQADFLACYISEHCGVKIHVQCSCYWWSIFDENVFTDAC